MIKAAWKYHGPRDYNFFQAIPTLHKNHHLLRPNYENVNHALPNKSYTHIFQRQWVKHTQHRETASPKVTGLLTIGLFSSLTHIMHAYEVKRSLQSSFFGDIFILKLFLAGLFNTWWWSTPKQRKQLKQIATHLCFSGVLCRSYISYHEHSGYCQELGKCSALNPLSTAKFSLDKCIYCYVRNKIFIDKQKQNICIPLWPHLSPSL